MENNQAQEVVESVYRTLSEGTKKLTSLKAEKAMVDSRITSGRYSETAIKEFREKAAEISKNSRKQADATIKAAHDAIEKFRSDAEARRNLMNPAEITPDIELLKAGIPLKQNDLESILDRCQGNNTMRILVQRYAAEHGIQLSGMYSDGKFEEEHLAKVLSQITHYYERWINTPKSRKMLHTFFADSFPALDVNAFEENE